MLYSFKESIYKMDIKGFVLISSIWHIAKRKSYLLYCINLFELVEMTIGINKMLQATITGTSNRYNLHMWFAVKEYLSKQITLT